MSSFEEAQEALARRNYEEAVRLYTVALEETGLTHGQRIRALNARGNAHLELGRFDQAMKDYAEVIALNPNSPFSYMSRSLARYKRGMLNEAIDDFSRMIALDPEYVYAYIYRSEAYFHLGLYDHAIADYNKLMELSPEDVFVYFHRGLSYFYLGEFELAENDFEDCLTFDPQDAQAMIWLYLSREHAGRTGELQLVAQSRHMNPKHWPNPVLFFLLDELSCEMLLEATVDPDPKLENERLSEAYFYIGQYHFLRGEEFKASEFFHKCLELGNQGFINSAARKELQRMGRET